MGKIDELSINKGVILFFFELIFLGISKILYNIKSDKLAENEKNSQIETICVSEFRLIKFRQ